MGERYLLDTNTVIYYSDANLPTAALDFLDSILIIEGNISVISKIELLGWVPPNPNDYLKIQQFVAKADVYTLTNEVIDQTILLRKNYKIKLPDAIIAATAIVHDFILISRNAGDFKKLPTIKFINPFTDL